MRKGNCADQPDWAVMCAHHTNKVCMYFQLRALLEMLCTHVAVNGVIQQSIANIGNSSQRHCTYIYISFSKDFDWQKHHFSLNIVLGIQTSSHIVCYRLPIADHYESCSWQGLLSTLKSKNITMSILAWRDKNHNFCPNAPVMRPMFLFLVKNKSLNDIKWWRTKFTILRMGMNNLNMQFYHLLQFYSFVSISGHQRWPHLLCHNVLLTFKHRLNEQKCPSMQLWLLAPIWRSR